MPVAIRPALVLDYTMTTPAAAETINYVASRPCVIYDCSAISLVFDPAGGTATVSRVTTGGVATPAFTALTLPATGAVVRMSAGYVLAQAVIAAAEAIRCAIAGGGATTSARLLLRVLPTAVPGEAPGYTGGTGQATNLT